MLRIDFRLDTTMWNEGFDKAEMPWLRLYTDNVSWASSLRPEMSVQIPHEPFPQIFNISTTVMDSPVTLPDAEQKEWEERHMDEHSDEMSWGYIRFAGVLNGLTDDQLNAFVAGRLSQWSGV